MRFVPSHSVPIGFGDKPSVAQVFFGATPAHNRELYQALRYHMDRDLLADILLSHQPSRSSC